MRGTPAAVFEVWPLLRALDCNISLYTRWHASIWLWLPMEILKPFIPCCVLVLHIFISNHIYTLVMLTHETRFGTNWAIFSDTPTFNKEVVFADKNLNQELTNR
jgi:hypothetical protein